MSRRTMCAASLFMATVVVAVVIVAQNAQPAVAIKTHEDAVYGMVVAPVTRHVYTTSTDGKVHRWKTSDWKSDLVAAVSEDPITAMALGPKTGRLVVSDRKGVIHLVELKSGRVLSKAEACVGPIAFLSLDPTEQLIASAAAPNVIRFWRTGGPRNDVLVKDGEDIVLVDDVQVARFVSSARLIVGCGSRGRGGGPKPGRLLLVERTAQGINTIATPTTGAVISMDVDSSGATAALGMDDGTVLLVGTKEPNSVLLAKRAGTIESVAFSRDGRFVAVGTSDGVLAVYETASHKELAAFSTRSHLWKVGFGPEGTSVIGGYDDGHLRIWALPKLSDK